MLELIRKLLPRDDQFTAYFAEHASKIAAAADLLQHMIANGGTVEDCFSAIQAREAEADDITRKIIQAAHRTFAAPFDRGEIIDLAKTLDDVIDLMEEAAREIRRYEVREFASHMKEMVGAARECAAILDEAIPLLDGMARHSERLRSLCYAIGKIEYQADQVLDAGLTALRRQGLDPAAYMERKEIYERLEEIVDKFDDVANVLEGILATHV